jgi:hypothetical protein
MMKCIVSVVTALCYKPDDRGFDSGSIPDEVIRFFSQPNSSSRTMALGSTQHLIEMSARNLPGDEGRLVLKADSLTAIFEPIIKKMWKPRRLIIVWTATACYRENFTSY